MTDAKSILSLWRRHFFTLLNCNKSETGENNEPKSPIDNARIEVPISDFNEVRRAIACLKNNNTAKAKIQSQSCKRHSNSAIVMPFFIKKASVPTFRQALTHSCRSSVLLFSSVILNSSQFLCERMEMQPLGTSSLADTINGSKSLSLQRFL